MQMKMVEAKVFAALCALLIIHFGSADHGEGSHVNASTSSAGSEGSSPAASTVGVVSHVVSHHLSDSDTGSGPNDTKSLSNDATLKEKNNGSVTTGPEQDSGSTIVTPSVTTALESKATQPLPPSPSAVSNTSTTHAPHIISSTAGLTQQDHHDQPNITATTESSIAPADSGNHTKANSSAEVTSSGPPKMESSTASTTVSSTPSSTTVATTIATTATTATVTTATAATTTTTVTTATATNSSSTTAQVSAMKSTSAPPSHSTLQTEGPHRGETSTRPSSPTTQGKGHVASPSQLNVNGEDTKMVPNSPTLDPLLASLVSAFIITAVIIILLLFLKLRKRGNQPEFRRLQDLPMDDMMEDTPLSMYSY